MGQPRGRCASCPAGSSHRAPWRQTYNVAYNAGNRWTAVDGTWPGQSLNLIVTGGNVVVAMGEKIGLLMPETAESGPQSGLAGVTSGVAGGSSTTGGSLAITSGGRLQICPLRMRISSVSLWMVIPQAAADGLWLCSRGHGRFRHR